jgi:hypothetical protein
VDTNGFGEGNGGRKNRRYELGLVRALGIGELWGSVKRGAEMRKENGGRRQVNVLFNKKPRKL